MPRSPASGSCRAEQPGDAPGIVHARPGAAKITVPLTAVIVGLSRPTPDT